VLGRRDDDHGRDGVMHSGEVLHGPEGAHGRGRGHGRH
jgi:hypothetical protein